jgi:hypothetical protein
MDNPASPAESPHGRIGIAAGVAIASAFELVRTASRAEAPPSPAPGAVHGCHGRRDPHGFGGSSRRIIGIAPPAATRDRIPESPPPHPLAGPAIKGRVRDIRRLRALVGARVASECRGLSSMRRRDPEYLRPKKKPPPRRVAQEGFMAAPVCRHEQTDLKGNSRCRRQQDRIDPTIKALSSPSHVIRPGGARLPTRVDPTSWFPTARTGRSLPPLWPNARSEIKVA